MLNSTRTKAGKTQKTFSIFAASLLATVGLTSMAGPANASVDSASTVSTTENITSDATTSKVSTLALCNGSNFEFEPIVYGIGVSTTTQQDVAMDSCVAVEAANTLNQAASGPGWVSLIAAKYPQVSISSGLAAAMINLNGDTLLNCAAEAQGQGIKFTINYAALSSIVICGPQSSAFPTPPYCPPGQVCPFGAKDL